MKAVLEGLLYVQGDLGVTLKQIQDILLSIMQVRA